MNLTESALNSVEVGGHTQCSNLFSPCSHTLSLLPPATEFANGYLVAAVRLREKSGLESKTRNNRNFKIKCPT